MEKLEFSEITPGMQVCVLYNGRPLANATVVKKFNRTGIFKLFIEGIKDLHGNYEDVDLDIVKSKCYGSNNSLQERKCDSCGHLLGVEMFSKNENRCCICDVDESTREGGKYAGI